MLFKRIRGWYRRRMYRPGQTLSRFIACDVRRDIKILSIDAIDNGEFIGQLRTINVLYIIKGLAKESAFSDPVTLNIKTMWNWTGAGWGGLPDGSSLAQRLLDDSK